MQNPVLLPIILLVMMIGCTVAGLRARHSFDRGVLFVFAGVNLVAFLVYLEKGIN